MDLRAAQLIRATGVEIHDTLSIYDIRGPYVIVEMGVASGFAILNLNDMTLTPVALLDTSVIAALFSPVWLGDEQMMVGLPIVTPIPTEQFKQD